MNVYFGCSVDERRLAKPMPVEIGAVGKILEGDLPAARPGSRLSLAFTLF